MISLQNFIEQIRHSDLTIGRALENANLGNIDISEIDKPVALDMDQITKNPEFKNSVYGEHTDNQLRKGYEGLSLENNASEFSKRMKDVVASWRDMTLSQKQEIMYEWGSFVAEKIGISNIPDIEVYREVNTTCGSYSPSENKIRLNEYNMSDPAEAFDTVAHEMCHTHQRECANDLSNMRHVMYKYNFDNYIRPEYSFERYESQLVEAEARAFAADFTGSIKDIIERLQ